jgi:hypothetical protein
MEVDDFDELQKTLTDELSKLPTALPTSDAASRLGQLTVPLLKEAAAAALPAKPTQGVYIAPLAANEPAAFGAGRASAVPADSSPRGS